MDWERMLEEEGMPAELPPLRCESLDVMLERGKEVSREHFDNLSAIFGCVFEPYVEESMKGLTEREAEIIRLKHIELMTERDIAGKLEISRRTVRKTLNRAREKMKKRLYRLEKLIEMAHFCRP